MSENENLMSIARGVLAEGNLALLTTSDAKGHSHATWMGAVLAGSMEEITTITSPKTTKIQNLRENPWGEWLFTSKSKETLLYLSGPTTLIETGPAKNKYWEKVPNKTQAYFLKFYDETTGFEVIQTRVEKIVLCKPMAMRKHVLR